MNNNILNIWKKLILISTIFIYSSVNGTDVCVQKTPCKCVFNNGTGFDLTPSAQSTFYTAHDFVNKNNSRQFDLTKYYFHPCFDVLPNVNNTNSNDTCGIPLSICRNVAKMHLQNTTGMYKMDDSVYNFMGTTNLTKFSIDGSSVIYFNGPSSTTVLLICAQSENRLQTYDLNEDNKIVLAFYSRDACLKQIEESGRSLGSTLLIIFFCFVIFYLVLGILTKKFLMGATGVEVVPNLGFWSDLPNLVKEGWMFTVNGFKLPARGSGPATSPDPNSYDSI